MASGMNPRPKVRVVADVQSMAQEAAGIAVTSAQEALPSLPFFRIALSGGNTPRPLYEKLAAEPFRGQIDWERLQVFFSDERFVPPDSPDSNYRMANQALLSRVPIPGSFVHGVPTLDISPEGAAQLYEENIRRVFELDEISVARFDLILLGMGPDGHTASLFPETAALSVTDRMVAANFVPAHQSWRITFTYPVLNAARRVLFLVAGQDKADAVGRIFSGDQSLPAARVEPTEGDLIWLLDQAAATNLPDEATNHGL
jgi:6-phosphogluconolactonase